jgi:hypothetical protein
MAVYHPKYRYPKKTGKLVESQVWWIEFQFGDKRIRESAKTTRKTLAVEYEKRRRLELERAYAGMPTEQAGRRIQCVSDVLKPFLETFHVNHRSKTVVSAKGRLKHVARLLGNVLLSDLTEDRIRRYIDARLSEGMTGRTINMEVQ